MKTVKGFEGIKEIKKDPNQLRVDHLNLVLDNIDLNASNQKFHKIEYFIRSYKITRLSLSSCQLSALTLHLPESLRALSISHNKFSSLVPTVLRAKQLKELNISHNHFKAIPKKLKKFPDIKNIDLSSNQIAKFNKKPFKHLKKINVLKLSNNKITSISVGLKYFLQLKELDLSHNQLKEIPEFFFEVYGQPQGHHSPIETLNLSHNPLSKLPKSLRSCILLVTLDIRGT